MKRHSTIVQLKFLIILAVPASSFADPTISWINPPEVIAIPAPQDGNEFLKVKVSGERPDMVYIAAPDSKIISARAFFEQTGKDEYTLNLSDSQIVSFARTADLSKGVRAYAEFLKGKAISTPVIRAKLSPLYKPIILNCDTLRVAQRGFVDLPGSQGQLRLYISDISNRETIPLIVSDNGDSCFAGAKMRAGESDTFEFREGERYTIVCEELRNNLIGTDYGIFRVCKTVDWESFQIDRLVRFIEESDALFVAGNKKKTGPEFAALLRAKINVDKANQPPFAKLMNTASAEIDPKSKCEVHEKDGRIVELSKWYETKHKIKESNAASSKPSS